MTDNEAAENAVRDAAVAAVAAVLRDQREKLSPWRLVDATEAALRQVLPCRVLIQTDLDCGQKIVRLAFSPRS